MFPLSFLSSIAVVDVVVNALYTVLVDTDTSNYHVCDNYDNEKIKVGGWVNCKAS